MHADARKSWAKAPEFYFKPPPDGPIKLGNVVADPASPEFPIASLATDLEPKIMYGEPERHRTILREYSSGAAASAHVRVYEVVTAHAGLVEGKELQNEYKMDSLEASFYAEMPSPHALEELRKNASVRNAMGPRWSQSVYIISGLRIARNFSLKHSVTQSGAADAGLGGMVSQDVSAEGSAKFSRTQKAEDCFDTSGDIVLAYQVLKVSKNWLGMGTDKVEKHRPRGAFLSSRQQSEDEQVDLSSRVIDEGDIDVDDVNWID